MARYNVKLIPACIRTSKAAAHADEFPITLSTDDFRAVYPFLADPMAAHMPMVQYRGCGHHSYGIVLDESGRMLGRDKVDALIDEHGF
jgi:hypothetical protein